MAGRQRKNELIQARQMHTALVMYFLEERSQSEIAKHLGVAHATVNRMIKRGRELGLVEIKIKSPIESLVDIEEQLTSVGKIRTALVTPAGSDNPETVLQNVGRLAYAHLLSVLKDGQTICITGGKGVSAVAGAMDGKAARNVDIVPATGLVQGKHYTDVNHVAALMADHLSARSLQIHAPLFADTPEMRQMLLQMESVRDVFDRARKADVAVVGIGSIHADESSYYDLHSRAASERKKILEAGADAELVAHLLKIDGSACDYWLNDVVVGLTMDEFLRIPVRIGVAAGQNKAAPILTVLRSGLIDTLVTDEATAKKVLELAQTTNDERAA